MKRVWVTTLVVVLLMAVLTTVVIRFRIDVGSEALVSDARTWEFRSAPRKDARATREGNAGECYLGQLRTAPGVDGARTLTVLQQAGTSRVVREESKVDYWSNVAWLKETLSCIELNRRGLPASTRGASEDVSQLVTKVTKDVAIIADWYVGVLTSQRDTRGALRICGDALGVAADTLALGGFEGMLPNLRLLAMLQPACARAVQAATNEERTEFVSALELMRTRVPSFAEVLDDERVMVELQLFGFALSSTRVSSLGPRAAVMATSRSPPLFEEAVLLFIWRRYDEQLRAIERAAATPLASRALEMTRVTTPISGGEIYDHISTILPSALRYDLYVAYHERIVRLGALLQALALLSNDAQATLPGHIAEHVVLKTNDSTLELRSIDTELTREPLELPAR